MKDDIKQAPENGSLQPQTQKAVSHDSPENIKGNSETKMCNCGKYPGQPCRCLEDALKANSVHAHSQEPQKQAALPNPKPNAVLTSMALIAASLIRTNIKSAAQLITIMNIMSVIHMNMQDADANIIMKKNMSIMRVTLAVQNTFILMISIVAAATTIPTSKTAWIRTGMSQRLSPLNINCFLQLSVH